MIEEHKAIEQFATLVATWMREQGIQQMVISEENLSKMGDDIVLLKWHEESREWTITVASKEEVEAKEPLPEG